MAWAWTTAMASSLSMVYPDQSFHDNAAAADDDDGYDDDGYDDDDEEEDGNDNDDDNDGDLAGLQEAERLDRLDEEQSSTQSHGRPLSSI